MAYKNLKTAIKQVIKSNDNQEITGDLLQSILLSIVNEIEALLCTTDENGFFVIDSSNYIGLKYDSNGFDVAKLSKHFIELAKASGLNGGDSNLEIVELN